MSTGKRIALVVGGIYLFLLVLTIGIFEIELHESEEQIAQLRVDP